MKRYLTVEGLALRGPSAGIRSEILVTLLPVKTPNDQPLIILDITLPSYYVTSRGLPVIHAAPASEAGPLIKVVYITGTPTLPFHHKTGE